jgi:trans-2,3-dihydro-3-hydroxyanthranilate isomerase
MRELRYEVVDVFTTTAFGGNPLAVFLDGQGLSTEMMQTIAAEMNLSESVFLLPPEDAANHHRLRIFTPKRELPFAGHPTVGTGFVLHRSSMVQANALRLEEKVGLIHVDVSPQSDGLVMVTMQQPVPQFGEIIEDRAVIADMLSVTPDAFIKSLPLQVVSAGVPFVYVPVKSLAHIRECRLRLNVWEQHLRDKSANQILMFTPETEQPGSTVHSRMFAPSMGIVEDPATGAAAGPLGAYLLRYGLVTPEQAGKMVNEQGIEMGRPSFIHIAVSGTPENITGVSIGGTSVHIASGTLHLPDPEI